MGFEHGGGKAGRRLRSLVSRRMNVLREMSKLRVSDDVS
jgi:hypothetical protein